MSEIVRFTAKQLKFIEWLASPRAERYPPTQEELAPELGVTSRTLRRWKTPELCEAVTQRARALLGDDLPEIYATLRKEAIKGSFQHIKLAMELAGEYVERHEMSGRGGGPIETVTHVDFRGLTDEQLERIAAGEDPRQVLDGPTGSG